MAEHRLPGRRITTDIDFMLFPLLKRQKHKPKRHLSLWTAALLVLSAALTSVAAPQNLLRLIEEERVSYAATASAVTNPVSSPLTKTPLRKRSAQYQAQHRVSFLRRVVQGVQTALVPDSTRFKTRFVAGHRSQFRHIPPTRLRLAASHQSSPRAPPVPLSFV